MPQNRSTPTPTLTAHERFDLLVDRSGTCHLWIGRTDRDGYGVFSLNGYPKWAHRFAWEEVHGPIPNGLLALHTCPGGDNPACVTVAHLRLGTNLDNARDRHERGGYAVGEQHGRAKLTPDDIRAIRASTGIVSQLALAAKFGVGPTQIARIQRREQWTHIA